MGSFGTGLAIAERLLKDVEEEREGLRTFTTPAKPRLSIQPDAPELGVLGMALIEGLTASAMRANTDPVAIVDQMIKEANPGRIILADMLSGLGEALSGRPFQMTRQRLMAREITRSEFNNQRDKALGAVFGQVLDYQEGIAAIESNSQGDAARAQGQILNVVEARSARQETLNNKIIAQREQGKVTQENQLNATELAVVKQELLNGLVPPGMQKEIEHWASLMTRTDISKEEQEHAGERFDALRKVQLAMMEQNEELKKRTAARFLVPPKHQQVITTTRNTPFGDESIVTTVDTRTGELIWRVHAGFAMNDAARKTMDSAFKQNELLNEMSGLMDGMGDSELVALQNATAGFFGAIKAAAGGLNAGEITEWLKDPKNEFQPTQIQARVFQLMGQLTAERVVEFTGAQATDNERKFIMTTMPALLSNANTFRGGINLLRIYAEFKGMRISQHMTERIPALGVGPTSENAMNARPFDVGRTLAMYNQRLLEDPNFLDGKTARDLIEDEWDRRAELAPAPGQ